MSVSKQKTKNEVEITPFEIVIFEQLGRNNTPWKIAKALRVPYLVDRVSKALKHMHKQGWVQDA
jgi:hypothetical protein